jgi:hypothetical protein
MHAPAPRVESTGRTRLVDGPWAMRAIHPIRASESISGSPGRRSRGGRGPARRPITPPGHPRRESEGRRAGDARRRRGFGRTRGVARPPSRTRGPSNRPWRSPGLSPLARPPDRSGSARRSPPSPAWRQSSSWGRSQCSARSRHLPRSSIGSTIGSTAPERADRTSGSWWTPAPPHKKSNGGAAGAFVALQRAIEPQARHVEQVPHVGLRVEDDEATGRGESIQRPKRWRSESGSFPF